MRRPPQPMLLMAAKADPPKGPKGRVIFEHPPSGRVGDLSLYDKSPGRAIRLEANGLLKHDKTSRSRCL